MKYTLPFWGCVAPCNTTNSDNFKQARILAQMATATYFI